jgi:hypothetical protein
MYDIIDVLNCIKVKYYKNYYENCPIVTFEDILRIFSELQIFDITPVECQNQIIFSQGWDGVNMSRSLVKTKKSMTFVYNLHTIEKKGENDTIENIRFDNWYILMNNGNIITEHTPNDTPNDALVDAPNNVTNNTAQNDTKNDTTNDIPIDTLGDATNYATKNDEEDTTNDMSSDDETSSDKTPKERIDKVINKPKVTIKELKECLSAFGLKVSGNKEALISRLKAHMNSGFL